MRTKWNRIVMALSLVGLVNLALPALANASNGVPSGPVVVSSLTKTYYNSERAYLLKLLKANYTSQSKKTSIPSEQKKLETLYNSQVSYLNSAKWLTYMIGVGNGAVNTARADVQGMGQKLTDIANQFFAFGSKSKSNKIRISSGVIVFDKMDKALLLVKAKLIASPGPMATKSKMKLALDSTLYSANFGFGHDKPWCIVVANSSSDVGLPIALGVSSNFIMHTYAKYSNHGLISLRVGGAAPVCVNGA